MNNLWSLKRGDITVYVGLQHECLAYLRKLWSPAVKVRTVVENKWSISRAGEGARRLGVL